MGTSFGGYSSGSDDDYLLDIPESGVAVGSGVINQPRRQAMPLPAYDQEDSDNERADNADNSATHNGVRNDANTGESEEESLPSVGGSEEDELDIFELVRAQNVGRRDEEDEYSLPSVDEEEDQELEPVEANSAPVGGFRVRVGPNGEEEIEFASESEEESFYEGSDSDDDPPWNEMLGAEPAVPFIVPNSVVARVVDGVNQRRASVAAVARIGQLSNENRVQGSSSTATGGNQQPQRASIDPLPRQRRAAASGGVRRRRKKGRGRKKAPKKKTKPKKPAAPPKPLGPLYIDEDWNGNNEYKEYSKKISKLKANRVHIHFKEGTDESLEPSQVQIAQEATENIVVDGEIPGPSTSITQRNVKTPLRSRTSRKLETVHSTAGYKIGQVQLDRCGIQGWPWKTKSELLAAHKDKEISDIILHVSDKPSESLVHMKVKRIIQGEQIQRERKGPLPKLTKKNSERELIFNVTQHYFYHVDPVGIPADLFSYRGLGYRKMFLVDFNQFDMTKQCFLLDVILLKSAILEDHDIHTIPQSGSTALQDVFTNFLGVAPPPPPPEENARQKEDIEWFYGQIRKYHKQEKLPPSDVPLQPATLKPLLRTYQRDAVHWMLYREGCLDHLEAHSSAEYQGKVDLIEAFLNKMYIPIELTEHISEKTELDSSEIKPAFYNPYTSYVSWKKPRVPKLPSGGILCDEMGLGKTVETLCLILLNKKPIPEELREYLDTEEMTMVDVKPATSTLSPENAKENKKASLETGTLDSDDSDYTMEAEVTSSRKRKNIRNGKGGKKTKKVISTKAIATTRIFQNRRRRAVSPCEFSTYTAATTESISQETNDVEEANVPSKRPQRKSAQQARLTTKAALEVIEKNLKGGTKRKRGESVDGKEKKSRSAPGQTYEALKVLYDTALQDYKFSDFVNTGPKFHGKFYDTEIEMRECFECICGSTEEEWKGAEIVKCGVCGSSQHVECVGFNRDLGILFGKLGRIYLCPHCEALETPFETKSTLIITPQSISHQWIQEIQRHVQDQRLSILFYKGVSHHGYIPPAKLGRYDIVITTYNVLSAELDYVDLPHCNSADGRRFRNPKRFLTIPSPLPSVFWWRVCLDEAQMVEGIGTKMSMMARRIQAVHRWCVTGTPVNKGLQDLFGLFVFLQVQPINYDIWWDVLVRNAFFRKETDLLYELFGQMIWRNGKQDVLNQLGIPPQTEVVNWLNFSPVETHFYKQQFEICSSRIMGGIRKLQRGSAVDIWDTRLSTLDRFSLQGLLAPFLELRQACCHPQIVKGQLISFQKGTLTMEELLDRLVKKTQLQCIDDHRLIIAALNGMAGLQIILNNWIEAAEKYREVLQSAEKHKEHFHTDSLQLLHTMENLAEVLDGNYAGIAFTLRDTTLRSDAEELRKKYMKKYADAVRSAADAVYQHTKAVEEIQNQFTMHKESWWVAALKAAQKVMKIDGLIQSLKQDLLDVTKKNVKNTNSVANKFNDRHGLEAALVPALMEMDDLRTSVLEGLEELQSSVPSVFVEPAIRCHLRQKSGSYYNDSGFGEKKCKLCMYHDNFLIYESVIFKTDKRDKIIRTGRNRQQRKLMGELDMDQVDDEISEQTKHELLQAEAEDLKATTEHVQLINEELRRGTWGDSETEVVLKGILRFARVNRLSHDISENGGVHIKFLEAVKKEFRYLRILWRQIFDQVSGLDELSQATTRLIAVDGDPQNHPEQPSTSSKVKQLSSGIQEKTMKIQNIHVIGLHEVEPKMTGMRTDYVTGQESLSLHLGQLLYLKTLKKNGYGKKGTFNTEDCPICAIQLGKEWSVLRCGHSFCSDCVKKMCPNALHSFACPLCRHTMKFADVSFVDTSENEQEMGPSTSTASASNAVMERKVKDVKGSHSTKVQAIVEKLLQLQDTHPGEKCIIFSMWTDVLEIIGNALSQNDIKHCLLNQAGRSFQTNLDKFKKREDLQVLLMPLSSGAKGLNIIEATHVCLVEPILNLASELQAIGRVHRIGQTKPTFVHRFYVKRTIEEKLFQILKVQDVSSDDEGSLTVKDLQNLLTITMSN